jgi:hypothetical protein
VLLPHFPPPLQIGFFSSFAHGQPEHPAASVMTAFSTNSLQSLDMSSTFQDKSTLIWLSVGHISDAGKRDGIRLLDIW